MVFGSLCACFAGTLTFAGVLEGCLECGEGLGALGQDVLRGGLWVRGKAKVMARLVQWRVQIEIVSVLARLLRFAAGIQSPFFRTRFVEMRIERGGGPFGWVFACNLSLFFLLASCP